MTRVRSARDPEEFGRSFCPQALVVGDTARDPHVVGYGPRDADQDMLARSDRCRLGV